MQTTPTAENKGKRPSLWFLQRLKRKSGALQKYLPVFPVLLFLRSRIIPFFVKKPFESDKARTKIFVSPEVSSKRQPVTIVTSHRYKNWVLGRLCKEMSKQTSYVFREVSVNALDNLQGKFFFPHWLVFAEAMLACGYSQKTEATIFFTHQQPSVKFSFSEQCYVLSKASHIICMNARDEAWLKSLDLNVKSITKVIGGIDTELFPPHARGQRKVGFCCAYYPRKNPQKILELVKAMPDVEFKLLGRGWKDKKIFGKLNAQGNFEYLELPYDQYSTFYEGIDVLVSMSDLEGGPIPLLEALSSNVIPVASDTGFARDVITHGQNGYIFEVDAAVDKIVPLINEALSHEGEVYHDTQKYSWAAFVSKIANIIA